MGDDANFKYFLDRTAIIDTVVGIANAIDAKDWTRVRSHLAAELDVDYSEFRGEPPARVTADAYVAGRVEGLSGLRTLHVSTNHEVTVSGDEGACVSSYQILRVDPVGGGRLETCGTYRHRLMRTAEGWRVTGIIQTVVRLEGDPTIHGALRAPVADPERAT